VVAKGLLSFQEIVERSQKGENLFDIAFEKWKRIRNCLFEKGKEELPAILENARMVGPFCVEFNFQCSLCPITHWCRDTNGFYQNIMRYLYLYGSTGDYYYKQRAIKEIDKFLEELSRFKQDFLKRAN